MSNPSSMSQLMAVNGNGSEVLGKLVYFSLANVMVDRDRLREICESMKIPYSQGARQTDANAFRRATTDIKGRITDSGHEYKIYCRENEADGDVLSKELVKETVDVTTNRYAKLANIQFCTSTGDLSISNVNFDPVVNPYQYFQQAEDLFAKYRRCAGRKHIETITSNMLDAMQAIKINIHGRIYFVPRPQMEQVALFEDFVEILNANNLSSCDLTVNSMYVADDAKQRKKMASEFYQSVQKEVALYQEKVEYLISSDSRSPAIMYRWINKIDALEQKKREYEEVLRQDLDRLDDDFKALRMFCQELAHRARNLEMQVKAA